LITPSPEFIRDNYKQHYFARRKSLCDSDEAALLNHYRPENYPNYGSAHFHKDGTTANGLQSVNALTKCPVSAFICCPETAHFHSQP